MPADIVQQPMWKIPSPRTDLGFDITDLLIYERQKQEEQRRRDEMFQRLPLPERAPAPTGEPYWQPPKAPSEVVIQLAGYDL